MRPHLALTMYFCTARVIRNAPRRCTLITVSQSLSDILNSRLSLVTPALLISTVGSPSSAATLSTAAWTWSASETSAPTAIALPPAFSMSATVSAPWSSLRSSTATASPSLARRLAVAAPIPRAAPVTIAIRCGIAFISFPQPDAAVGERRCSSVIIPDSGRFATCGPLTRKGTVSGVNVRTGLGTTVSSFTGRGLVVSAVVAGVLAAATGCATKGVPYKTPSSAPAPTAPAAASPAGPMTPVPQASGQLTGTQLQSVLLPQSYFPAGFTLSSSSAVTSGGALLSSPAAYQLATISCATFINHLGSTGFGETAMASNSFVGQAQAFDQVVYQFGSSSEATAFVAGIRALAARCGSFSATANGTSGTFSLKAATAAPVGGHPSLELFQTGTLKGSPVTLDTLLTASGVDVFAGSAVGVGTTAPTSVAKQTIVYNLMKRQAAAAVLS